MPVPMIDRLHISLRIFVEGLGLWRIEFIENAVSGAWNTGHRVEWTDSARKGSRPSNAKQCS